MNSLFSPRNIFVLVALILAASTRIIEHPDNFTAVGAMALFAGAVMTSRFASMIASMLMLFATDAYIGFYDGFWIVYIAFGLSVVTGWVISKRQNIFSIIGGSLTAALLFFLVSNFSVWTSSGMYPHTGAGLADCFTKALPFFWNGLASQFVYGAILFGGYHLLKVYKPSLVKA